MSLLIIGITHVTKHLQVDAEIILRVVVKTSCVRRYPLKVSGNTVPSSAWYRNSKLSVCRKPIASASTGRTSICAIITMPSWSDWLAC